jgi:NADPH:quinone reductase-like Zn-dependent oxidoreductase
MGSLAEYVTVSAAHGVAHIPDGLGVRDAGALGLAGTLGKVAVTCS